MNDQSLASRFSAHQATPDHIAEMKSIRSVCGEVAELIAITCPNGREQSLALTKLEEAMFWANAAISRQDPVLPS